MTILSPRVEGVGVGLLHGDDDVEAVALAESIGGGRVERPCNAAAPRMASATRTKAVAEAQPPHVRYWSSHTRTVARGS